MSLPIRFEGMGVGDLVALANAAHVGAAGLAVGSAFRFLLVQDARVRRDTHDGVPMEPTMYIWLANAMITAVSRRPNAPGGDSDDNAHMWSLELTSAWARLYATCGFQVLAESESLITTALTILPTKRPTVARSWMRSRSPTKQRALYSVP
jgi:hypothetical protein